MPMSAGRPSTVCGNSTEYYGCKAKTTDIGAASRQIPQSKIIFGLENTIQKSSDYLF